MLELAGVMTPPRDIDGVSLLPVLGDPNASVRNYLYTERFDNNGTGPYQNHDKAIADGNYRYKLRESRGVDYFYRLDPDPNEPRSPKREILLCSGSGCSSLPAAEASMYRQLRNEMDRICP